MAERQSTEEAVRGFILKEFLEGEDPSSLEAATPLISSGVLNSLAILKLVTFLEEEFEIEIDPEEADEDTIDTVAAIVALIRAKRGS